MNLLREIKPEIIEKMAEMLDMGMIRFYNIQTGEMDYYPDELKNPEFDEEAWLKLSIK